MACVKIGEGRGSKFGFIDNTGKFVINPQFDACGDYAGAGSFSEGLAAVESNEKWGYIDKTGKYVINPQFDKAEEFSGGLARVKIGDKVGYIDKTSKYIWNPTN